MKLLYTQRRVEKSPGSRRLACGLKNKRTTKKPPSLFELCIRYRTRTIQKSGASGFQNQLTSIDGRTISRVKAWLTGVLAGIREPPNCRLKREPPEPSLEHLLGHGGAGDLAEGLQHVTVTRGLSAAQRPLETAL